MQAVRASQNSDARNGAEQIELKSTVEKCFSERAEMKQLSLGNAKS